MRKKVRLCHQRAFPHIVGMQGALPFAWAIARALAPSYRKSPFCPSDRLEWYMRGTLIQSCSAIGQALFAIALLRRLGLSSKTMSLSNKQS